MTDLSVMEERIAVLVNLEKRAGAALTFWQHATEAMKAHGTDGVNWADVEQKTILESISEHGQPASQIVLHEFAEPFGCNGSTAYGDHLFEYMRRA